MSNYNANLWDDRPYRPTSVTISIDEWDRMNEELQALRQWKEAAIKSSSWNVRTKPSIVDLQAIEHNLKTFCHTNKIDWDGIRVYPNPKPPYFAISIDIDKVNESGIEAIQRHMDTLQNIGRIGMTIKPTTPESYENDLEIIGKVRFGKSEKDALLEEMQQEYVKNWSDLKTAGEMGIAPPFKPESYQWTSGKHDRTHPDEVAKDMYLKGEISPSELFKVCGSLTPEKDLAEILEGKHDRTLDPDTSKEYGWQPKKDENYFAWDTDFGVQSFVNLSPEMGRIDMERFGRLFPTKEAAEDYGRTTTTNALLPLMELKMAVDRGETIVDNYGDEIGKNEGQYYFRRSDLKLAHAVKSNEWNSVWCLGIVTKGWRIKPTTPSTDEPTDDYLSPERALYQIGLGKTVKSDDGTIAFCKSVGWVEFQTPNENPMIMARSFRYPSEYAIKDGLSKHKNWKKV